MFLAGSKVPSETIGCALTRFRQFLAECEPPCILVAHNCTFDKVRLMNNITAAGMYEELAPMIDSFVDTLKVFRDVLPGRSKYDLGSLAKDSGVSTVGAHNALADGKMLCNLLMFHRVEESKLLECKQTLTEYVKIVSAEKDLAPIVSIVSRNIKKIIGAGLTMETIKKTYEKNGYLGIADLLSEKNGQMCVTKSKNVIKKVVDILKKISQ